MAVQSHLVELERKHRVHCDAGDPVMGRIILLVLLVAAPTLLRAQGTCRLNRVGTCVATGDATSGLHQIPDVIRESEARRQSG